MFTRLFRAGISLCSAGESLEIRVTRCHSTFSARIPLEEVERVPSPREHDRQADSACQSDNTTRCAFFFFFFFLFLLTRRTLCVS